MLSEGSSGKVILVYSLEKDITCVAKCINKSYIHSSNEDLVSNY